MLTEDFSWQWDTSASDNTNLLQEDNAASKSLLMEFGSHLGNIQLLPGLMKESVRNSTWHRRKWMSNCQYRWKSLSNFLLHGKVYWILPACRLKTDVLTLQMNFGWLSRQRDVSVNSIVLDVAYNAFPVYLGNIISFWGLRCSWWQIVIVFLSYSKR